MVGSTGKLKGIVKLFNDFKGFGFIACKDLDEDIFVHSSSIRRRIRSLTVGESVEFVIGFCKDGRTKADNVTRPDGNPVQDSKGGNSNPGSESSSIQGGFGGSGSKCEENGELASECGQNGLNLGDGLDEEFGGSGCHMCGEYGHMMEDCIRSGGGSGRYGRSRDLAVVIRVGRSISQECASGQIIETGK